MEANKHLNCPNCGNEIDIDRVLFHQIEAQIKKEIDVEHQAKLKALNAQKKQIDEEKAALLEAQENINAQVAAQLAVQIKAEKQRLENSLKEKLSEESQQQLAMLHEELKEKGAQISEMQKTKIELERLKRDNESLVEKITLEKEMELSKRIRDEKLKIKQSVEQEHHLKQLDYEKRIADQNKLIEEMRRKSEQGSMQLQGEVLEIAIEDLLRDMYRYDDIEEIKKGQRGADLIQHVKTHHGEKCGTIYYESKRTKSFSHAWLQKLKDDNLQMKADILVLVTEALPDDIERFGQKEGIWICTFSEVKGLSMLLRHGLMKVHSVAVTQQDKGDKMELLYHYLTSQEFRGQFEAIIEGFKEIQDSYHDEKLKMNKIWKQREKQLEKILLNAVDFYGSLKGIAGSSIPDIKMLEDKT